MSRHVGIGKESAYGTAVAPTVFFEALTEDVHLERANESVATIRSFVPVVLVELTKIVKGSTEVLAAYEDMFALFKTFFGAVDTTGTDPYTHTYPKSTGLADRTISMTMETKRDGANVRYAGIKIMSFGISSSTDRATRITFGYTGKSAAEVAAAAATYPVLKILPPTDMAVKINPNAEGVVTMGAKSFEMNAEWPVDEPFQLGSAELAATPIDIVMAVTGSCEVHHVGAAADDLYSHYLLNNDIDVELEADNATESLTLNMDKAKFTRADPGMSGRERLVAVYEWESVFSTTATSNLQAIVVNSDDGLGW